MARVFVRSGRLEITSFIFLAGLFLADSGHWRRYLEMKEIGSQIYQGWHDLQFSELWTKDALFLLIIVFSSFLSVETYFALRKHRFDRWMIYRATRMSWILSLTTVPLAAALMTAAVLFVYVIVCLLAMPAAEKGAGLTFAVAPAALFSLVSFLSAGLALLWTALTENRWTALFSPVFVLYGGIILHERFLPERPEMSLKHWIGTGLDEFRQAWPVLAAAALVTILFFAGRESYRLRKL